MYWKRLQAKHTESANEMKKKEKNTKRFKILCSYSIEAMAMIAHYHNITSMVQSPMKRKNEISAVKIRTQKNIQNIKCVTKCRSWAMEWIDRTNWRKYSDKETKLLQRQMQKNKEKCTKQRKTKFMRCVGERILCKCIANKPQNWSKRERFTKRKLRW